jgi:hypothetical protein
MRYLSHRSQPVCNILVATTLALPIVFSNFLDPFNGGITNHPTVLNDLGERPSGNSFPLRRRNRRQAKGVEVRSAKRAATSCPQCAAGSITDCGGASVASLRHLTVGQYRSHMTSTERRCGRSELAALHGVRHGCVAK